MLISAAAALTACPASEGQGDVRDADVQRDAKTEIDKIDDVGAESIDRSAADADSYADQAPESEDASTSDVADEAGECVDVFGPVYVPDADDTMACSANVPCGRDYVCFGLSCDDRWECLPHYRAHPCPTEAVPHCGCDGVTFESANSCAKRPYLHIGACGDGTNCDPTDLRCSQPEPSCPPGWLASVVDGVYGPCVPFSSCRCEYLWECAHRETYVCDRTTWRCAELHDD